MKNFSKKLRSAGLIMCFALVASLAMEGSLEAQKRGRGGGGGGKSSMRRGGGGGGGSMQRGGSNRGQMQRGRSNRGQMQRGGNVNRSRGTQRRGQQQQRGKIQNGRHKGHGHQSHKGHQQHRGHHGHKKHHGHHGHKKHHGHHGHKNHHGHHGHKNHHGHGHHRWKHHQNKYHVGHRHRHDYHWRYDYCHKVRHNRQYCWDYTKWCGYYPSGCHWWYNYCGPKYYFDPSFCVTYDWNYCDYYYQGAVYGQYQWYLGMNCVYIPGMGYGVQEVYEGSPAAAAGMQQGMIITSANGRKLESESIMTDLMQTTNGQLSFDVVANQGGQQQQFDINMVRTAR